MHSPANPEWDQIRSHIREHLRMLFGVHDSSGMELFILLQSVAHLSRNLDTRLGDEKELSGPRWRLLLRLLIEEHRGDTDGPTPTDGLTPTELSHSQRVGKNTISALLRGLETQGLIQRNLDSADLRTFRIQLTQAGRDYLRAAAPVRVETLNRILSGLDPHEQARLTALLEKLQRSLLEQCQPAWKAEESQTAGAEGASGAAMTEECINQ
jgi:DNA-binding MarR family transcriptional regulator